MLNVYNFYDNPEGLVLFDEKNPEIVAIQILMDDPYDLTGEQQKILKKSHIVVTTPSMAYKFARYVLDDRWPEAEPYIAKSPRYAYEYTLNVIDVVHMRKGEKNRRWDDGESAIMSDPVYANFYARFVMNVRWPEAEPIIKKQDKSWNQYAQHFQIDE